MAGWSSIEWTEATWNPITGCSKIGAGCEHCYAERMAWRLKAMGNPRYAQGFQLTLHSDLVDLPLTWRQPRVIFVNSMSDLFHEKVPLSFLRTVFATMQAAHWHVFQVLTKRAKRLAELAPELPWPRNLWMGVTVEQQDYAWRLECLRQVPAAVRFLSCEPLLGPLSIDLAGVDWLIVGGESGPSARPMDTRWARCLRDQCRRARVPFFLKQLGGTIDKRGKERALLDGRLWRELPRAHASLKVADQRASLGSPCDRRRA